MFGRKKEAKTQSGKGKHLAAQMGIGDLSALDQMVYGDLEGDEDLEAELAMLQGQDSPPKQRNTGGKGAVDMGGLMLIDKMATESLQDIGDEDISDVDEDDPDLLAELQGLQRDDLSPPKAQRAPSPRAVVVPSEGPDTVSVLQDRINMYTTAMANAKASNESSKVRRLDRGLKSLQGLLRSAKAGKAVKEDDIPPPVAIGGASSPKPASTPEQPAPPPPRTEEVEVFEPTTSASQEPAPKPVPAPRSRPVPAPRAAPPPPQQTATSATQQEHPELYSRRDQYRLAALQAKRSGDLARAKSLFTTSKQFDHVIAAAEAGNAVDLSRMPPPLNSTTGGSVERSRLQGHNDSASGGAPAVSVPEDIPQVSHEEEKELFQAPDKPSSTMEALKQRLEKYRSAASKAKEEGNSSKARRMGRIVKQYEDAIRAEKAGRPVDYEELPTPPGFAPIPTGGRTPQPSPKPSPGPSPSSSAPQLQANRGQGPSPQASQRSPGQKPSPPKRSLSHSKSRAEQQCEFLQERQKEFKVAALEAKQNGDMELAKKYLRMSKGFDPMILASQSGLPVDLTQVPASPHSKDEDGFETVSEEDAALEVSGTREEQYKTLEQTLINQIRTCGANSAHFTQLGDVSSAGKFDKMSQNCRKDLDALRNAFRYGDPVPRFHHEPRVFSLVKTNTDLGDADLEMTVVRGIHMGLPTDYKPEDLDTYVKYEFPYPNDDPQKGETNTVKHTNSPEYEQSFRLKIDRKARTFARMVKSKSLKLEIYYKRGFFKSDKVLGSVSVKLLPLESQCTIHDSYDMMDGRKSAGGKLEVKVRIRDPLVSKQVEEVRERWLVIDKFDRALSSPGGAQSRSRSPRRPESAVTSIEVLKYEKQLLDKQIAAFKGKLNQSQEAALVQKSQQLQQKYEQQQTQLKQGGINAYKAYADAIAKSMEEYQEEAACLAKEGNLEKAQVVLNKKKLVEKEVTVIRSKLAGR